MRFHLDEHVDPRIAVGLRRRGIDVSTTNEAHLRTLSDDEQLTYAQATNRVLVTCDAGFVARHNAGVHHQGIVYFHAGSRSIGEVITFLALLAEVLTQEEMIGQLEFA